MIRGRDSPNFQNHWVLSESWHEPQKWRLEDDFPPLEMDGNGGHGYSIVTFRTRILRTWQHMVPQKPQEDLTNLH